MRQKRTDVTFDHATFSWGYGCIWTAVSFHHMCLQFGPSLSCAPIRQSQNPLCQRRTSFYMDQRLSDILYKLEIWFGSLKIGYLLLFCCYICCELALKKYTKMNGLLNARDLSHCDYCMVIQSFYVSPTVILILWLMEHVTFKYMPECWMEKRAKATNVLLAEHKHGHLLYHLISEWY